MKTYKLVAVRGDARETLFEGDTTEGGAIAEFNAVLRRSKDADRVILTHENCVIKMHVTRNSLTDAPRHGGGYIVRP
jgi:hypothetical protein